jgi:uncharacterized membrane protein
MMFAFGAITIFFAMVSVVSALVLAYLVYRDAPAPTRANGMDAFHRHLDALSDESRAHLRQQLRESRERQGRK